MGKKREMPQFSVDIDVEDNLGEEIDEPTPFKYSITSYGADFPVDGLVKRLRNSSIVIPSFQRGFVWTVRQASRFIESLLLGLPVPGIFLSKDDESQKLLVIDGQQRLRTLLYFYEGEFAETGRVFRLTGVQPQFEGLTYKTLSDEDRRRLDDSIIHATIIKQDEPSGDNSSIYHVFERLNTGGTLLQPQEIRSCVYHGEFHQLLQHLNQNKYWRSIFGPPHSRMKDQELILRFFALYYNGENYTKPMKGFLNNFMAKHRHLTEAEQEVFAKTFTSAIEVVYKAIGRSAFKTTRVLNAGVFDSVMCGIAKRLERGPITELDEVRKQYFRLIESDEYRKVVETSTADKENVRRRLALAIEAFGDVR